MSGDVSSGPSLAALSPDPATLVQVEKLQFSIRTPFDYTGLNCDYTSPIFENSQGSLIDGRADGLET